MSTTTAPTRFGLPRTIRLGVRHIGFELRQYFRAGDQVFGSTWSGPCHHLRDLARL